MLKIFTHLKNRFQTPSSQSLGFMHTKIHQKKNQKGQILLEYILLIVIVVAIAQALMSELVQRTPGNQGVVIKTWIGVSEIIANDPTDEPE